MSEQEMGAAFPVGTRVKYRAGLVNLCSWDRAPGDIGVVQDTNTEWDGQHVLVRWGDREPEWEDVANLEAATRGGSSRAPERLLAPGVVVSADTCDGKPVIQGTRLRCDSMYSYWLREVQEGHDPESALGRVATDYHTGMSSVRDAVVWQAAVRYTKERRKAKRKGGGAPT